MDFLPAPKVVIEPAVPQVAGPFALALRWSGFDLGTSSKSGSKIAIVLATTICIVLCFLFTAALITTVTEEGTPLSVKWADVNTLMSLIVYSLACGICLASWTKRGFLETFQRELARLRTLRVLPNEQIDTFRGPFIKAGIFSVFLILTWTLAALKGVVFQTTIPSYNGTSPTRFNISWRNLYGAMPVVYLMMGVTSSIATAIYWLTHEHLRREMSYFNEELVKASRSQQLTVPDVFAAYGRRHLDLMALMQHVHTHLGKLVTVGGFCATFAFINSVFIISTYNKHLTPPYMVLVVLWTIVVPGLMMITMGEPGRIHETIEQTRTILLDDVTLPSATDQRILSAYRMFTDRCNWCSSMTLLHAIPIKRYTFNKIIFIAPQISTVLAMVAKLMHL